jgi:CheY-like chemotaxis protein
MSRDTDNVIDTHDTSDDSGLDEKPSNPEPAGQRPPAIRIVVADDEAGVRGFLREVLELEGYEVIEAANGKQAVEAINEGHVDLVIMDLVMPEQEGIETILALRKIAPRIQIIAISGAFGGELLNGAKILGAVACLMKPIRVESLLVTVAEALQSRR